MKAKKFFHPERFKIRTWPRLIADISRDIARQMHESRLLLFAASLAYTTILSIVPLLAVSFAIFQAFGGLEKLFDTIAPFILKNLAESASDDAIVALRRFIDNAQTNVIGVSGLLALVLTSVIMLSSAEDAINQIWLSPINRTWFQRLSAYWLFITLGPIALAVVVGAATSTEVPLVRLLPSGAALFLMTVGIFFLVYKYVPTRRVRWHYALSAGLVATSLLELARLSYALYTKHVITYSKIYGSLGAIPILLLWIFIVWLIVLGGAALSAALQNRFEGVTTGGKRDARA